MPRPRSSPAAQNVVVGHETPDMYVAPSTLPSAQVAEAPAAGPVEATASPFPTATHMEDEAQETPFSPLGATPLFTTQVAIAPVAALVDVKTLPLASTATQRDAEAHETPLKGGAPGIAV